MLVLARRVGEEIVIGDEVIVQVLEVRGNSVRLGITAPRDIPVHRGEVQEAIERRAKSCASLDGALRGG